MLDSETTGDVMRRATSCRGWTEPRYNGITGNKNFPLQPAFSGVPTSLSRKIIMDFEFNFLSNPTIFPVLGEDTASESNHFF